MQERMIHKEPNLQLKLNASYVLAFIGAGDSYFVDKY